MSNYTGAVPDTHRRKHDWRDTALCRSESPELFFPKGDSGPWLIGIEQAKAICRRCPALEACLQFALTEDITNGIFGGLTEQERASLRRSTQRRGLTPEAAAKKVQQARQSHKPRTLRSIYEDGIARIEGGHLAWRSNNKITYKGQVFTPKQLSFFLDRGHMPDGRVTAECGITECVLPVHIADVAERARCGTRPGYRRHLRNGEPIDDACRQANTDADNRLRRTGTTKAAA